MQRRHFLLGSVAALPAQDRRTDTGTRTRCRGNELPEGR